MAAAGVMAGVAVAGTAVQMYGEYEAAQSKAESEARQAAMKRQQADEVQARQTINEGVMREQEYHSEGDYVTKVGGHGVEGSWFGGMMRMRQDLAYNIAATRREADFKAQMLREGADVNTQLASDSKTAGYLGIGASLITGAGKAYTAANKPSGIAQDLPS
jgi:hypothetical protein